MNQGMKWSKAPFERCIEYLHQVDRVLHLCLQGISHVSRMPPLAKALAELHKEDKQAPFTLEQQRDLDETNARAEFAMTEIESGFPVLHAHTVIAFWGGLDALVADLAAAWLTNAPDTLQNERFAKIKIPLAAYDSLSKEERMAFLVKELARSLNADFKLGVGKFEVILEALGLGGPIEDDLKRTLFEMSQARNVLVHRAGIIDQRFKQSCPWYPADTGEKLEIDHKRYVAYREATQEYVLCLINRVRVRFGLGTYEGPQNNGPTKEGAA